MWLQQPLSCCGPKGAESATVGSAGLTGAGATFPGTIYTKWFDGYAREPGVRINYQSIGSGGGIRQFTEGTVDFGATDAPMTDEQVEAVKGRVADATVPVTNPLHGRDRPGNTKV